jgi:hypothetical protein
MAHQQLQQNNIHGAFSSVLESSFGSGANAPGSVYSPQRADKANLQRRFRNTSPEHIQAVYDMAGGSYPKAVDLLLAANQQDFNAPSD